MIKITNLKTFNWEGAIRGMRNALQSWNKIDSHFGYYFNNKSEAIGLGINDYSLCVKLIKAGSSHRKFLRQIFVSCDIEAPEYYFKEYHTYKINTVENSTSTMHTITNRYLTKDDFSFDVFGLEEEKILKTLNHLIEMYKELDIEDDNRKNIWRNIIQLLPMSFNYTKTCTMNYEVIRNIISQRKNHKLDEWKMFCRYMIGNLPYSEFVNI